MTLSPDLPPDTGTYLLSLHLPSPAVITIGARGDITFPAGDYLYIGSAFGSGGLRTRLSHHLRPLKRCHWHVDYLRQYAPVRDIWYSTDDEKHECHWATILLTHPQTQIMATDFGASDCRCSTHLLQVLSSALLDKLPQILSVSLTHQRISTN